MNSSTGRPLLALVRILGLSLVMVALFLGSAGLCVLLVAWSCGAAWLSPLSLCGGMTCALIAWLFVFTFHLKREVLLLPPSSQANIGKLISELLAEMGYEVSRPDRDHIVGKPAFTAFLFGGTIQVHLQEQGIRLSGPKVSLEKVRHQLRLFAVLDSERKCLENSGLLFRGVPQHGLQIHLRVSGDQEQLPLRELVQALKQQGAQVTCEINLWVEGGPSALEETVEDLVQDTLRQQSFTMTVRPKTADSRRMLVG
jgi:hypothetical protein